MYKKITEYLYCLKTPGWHEINGLLIELFSSDTEEARTILVTLVKNGRIKIKEDRHKRLLTHQNLTGYDPTNTFATLSNWTIEAKLTEEEKEKIDMEMKQPTPKDYKFEILSYLFNQGNATVNIRPLIDDLVSEGHHSGVWFGTQLDSMKAKKHIWFDDVLCLSWVKNSMYSPDHPIKARIDPDGIAEYKRLDALYNPPAPVTSSTTIITHGKYSPVSGRDVNQTGRKPDKEGIRIAKSTLYWTIGIGAALILLTLWLVLHGG